MSTRTLARPLVLLSAVLILAAPLLLTGCRGAPLLNPGPIAALKDSDKTHRAILRALPRRGWTLVEEEPGRIRARLDIRAHTAVVDVRYDDKNVWIQYVDSTNLEHTVHEGNSYIHSNYNDWVRNLLKDISAEMMAMRTRDN